MLHLPLGGVHRAVLLRAGDGVEARLLGALVGENEADVGFIADDGGNAGVEVHVVPDGDIVVALRGDGHVTLTENGVPKAVVIHAVIVVLIDDQLRGVHMIHPGGRLLVILALAGDGVDQHGAVVVHAAEQSDGLFLLRAHPVGRAVLVDLKDGAFEHHRGILEAQMTVEVAGEMLRGGVLHAFLQTDDLDILRHHIDDQIGGQTLGAVVEPLDDIAVAQGRYTHGTPVVIDLGIVLGNLKLGDHIRQFAELAVAELFGAALVEHGDLVIGDLVHLVGEVRRCDGQQRLIIVCPQHDPGADPADDRRDDQRGDDKKRDRALLFHKAEIALDALALKAGGDERADAVHCAQQKYKAVKFLRVQIDGRQLHIKVDRAEQKRHQRIDRDALAFAADGLSRLALTLWRCVEVDLEPLRIRAVEFEFHTAFLLIRYEKIDAFFTLPHHTTQHA